MARTEYEPGKNLGEEIKGLGRQAVFDLVLEVCKVIRSEAGDRYRGGVYPENLRRDAAGELVIGDGRASDWDGQELDFIAPELYWHGKESQAADVYSTALLLYYGLTGGKLPFEGESSNAQLTRMSGKAIKAPKGCGPRLTEVIEKALAFREEDRYQSVDELAVMLDSCAENKYLRGEEAARGIFRKDAGELSEMEKMMMSIIGGGEPSEPLRARRGAGLPEPRAPLPLGGLLPFPAGRGRAHRDAGSGGQRSAASLLRRHAGASGFEPQEIPQTGDRFIHRLLPRSRALRA